MKKKAVIILLTASLAMQGALSPALCAAAQEEAAALGETASEGETAAQGETAPVGGPAPVEEPAPVGEPAPAGESAQTEEAAPAGESRQASATEENSIPEKGTQIGGDLYKKVDEAIDSVDKKSLRKAVREALEEMDERGISPTAVAENALGIRTTYSGREKTPENTLIRDAQNAVQKKTDGFFSMLWDGFLDTLENMIMSGISIFGGEEKTGAAAGGSK